MQIYTVSGTSGWVSRRPVGQRFSMICPRARIVECRATDTDNRVQLREQVKQFYFYHGTKCVLSMLLTCFLKCTTDKSFPTTDVTCSTKKCKYTICLPTFSILEQYRRFQLYAVPPRRTLLFPVSADVNDDIKIQKDPFNACTRIAINFYVAYQLHSRKKVRLRLLQTSAASNSKNESMTSWM